MNGMEKRKKNCMQVDDNINNDPRVKTTRLADRPLSRGERSMYQVLLYDKLLIALYPLQHRSPIGCGDEALRFYVGCPRNGTAVWKGFSQ